MSIGGVVFVRVAIGWSPHDGTDPVLHRVGHDVSQGRWRLRLHQGHQRTHGCFSKVGGRDYNTIVFVDISTDLQLINIKLIYYLSFLNNTVD